MSDSNQTNWSVVAKPFSAEACPACGERAMAYGPAVGLWFCVACRKSFSPDQVKDGEQDKALARLLGACEEWLEIQDEVIAQHAIDPNNEAWEMQNAQAMRRTTEALDRAIREWRKYNN